MRSDDDDIRNLATQPLMTEVMRSKRLRRAGQVVRAPSDRGILKTQDEMDAIVRGPGIGRLRP